ncbi:CGNR zinc finger domain-containing protein [Cellulomonas sp. Leaf395]|uniref:CGNR zinc finger domain-containing protein n=1 Tax=Cellulomonas sp. Leaf395 TaxID=1736362 RepID=UPI00138F75E7|nr:CGNR zinc finger domain-containing protein [Cellulomonas sp. Leaf395]
MEQQVVPELVGGALCLDVANSVDGRVLDVPLDYLTTYADLVDWALRAGGLSSAEAEALRARADADPDAASEELVRVRGLREAVFAMFYGHATDGVAGADHLTAVQESYTDALRHGRLEPGAAGLRWTWEPDLRLPRWLVAQSAIELATSGSLDRVKACASQDGCQYLFVDTSKNGSRRWCSMTDCGNQAKSKRLTARRRAVRTGAR